MLDPALLRPGRFDRRVTVQPPDRAGRAAILQGPHPRRAAGAGRRPRPTIAGETPGLVGADLRNLVNEAALLAARKGQDAVGAEDFSEALEKIALGRRAPAGAARRRSASASPTTRPATRCSGLLQPEGDPVRRVTIVPRGQALGVTLSVPEDDRYNYGEAVPAGAHRQRAGRPGGRADRLRRGDDRRRERPQAGDRPGARDGDALGHERRRSGLLSLSGGEEGNFLETGFGGGTPRPYSEETAQAIDDGHHAHRRRGLRHGARAADARARAAGGADRGAAARGVAGRGADARRRGP